MWIESPTVGDSESETQHTRHDGFQKMLGFTRHLVISGFYACLVGSFRCVRFLDGFVQPNLQESI